MKKIQIVFILTIGYLFSNNYNINKEFEKTNFNINDLILFRLYLKPEKQILKVYQTSNYYLKTSNFRLRESINKINYVEMDINSNLKYNIKSLKNSLNFFLSSSVKTFYLKGELKTDDIHNIINNTKIIIRNEIGIYGFKLEMNSLSPAGRIKQDYCITFIRNLI
tara:strand:+ start:815 stop:1309 length:495 start_codon:yes stop_codon:yes gene_type:complete